LESRNEAFRSDCDCQTLGARMISDASTFDPLAHGTSVGTPSIDGVARSLGASDTVDVTANVAALDGAAHSPSLGDEIQLTRTDSLPDFFGPRTLPDSYREVSWRARYRLLETLGNGAQGVVYLALRGGADGYETKVAMKFYFRDRLREAEEYVREMKRVARQAQRISEIQNDNLVTIRDFLMVDETRVMIMEWIDGLDLRHLLDLKRFRELQNRLSRAEWERLNDVVVSPGPHHCRLKPGVAVDVVRGCLAGLSDLHHHGIVHCDIKPSNIMIKRTGTNKIIDIDSSTCLADEETEIVRGTPYYMAPEQIRERRVNYASDIASLGYVLIEMLTGRLLFENCRSIEELVEAKSSLPRRLETVLDKETMSDPVLFGLLRKMVAVDPAERFPDADAAELDRRHGAASFHRRLVKTDLSTEYDREVAWWIEACARSERERRG
jgi:serine/threonine protein kinase